jgi:POT family proton-dependent oligopeptide transporter
MFKGHPKGLVIAFLTNMGERFGFYTMMAILALFLQAKFGLDEAKAGDIYSWFYFAIYALALVGGLIADATNKYKAVILAGIIIMFIGYAIVAFPGMTYTITIIGLFTIALGNGLFKGNLQAVVGQMYDDPKYNHLRDSAYMVFYMGINVGAFFAPFAATGMRNWMLKTNGFLHDGSLPAMCHQFINGTLKDTGNFQTLADKVSLKGPVADLGAFAHQYLEVFSRGYNYAFGIAAGAMVISLLVYIFFNKMLPTKEKAPKKEGENLSRKPLTILASLGVAVLTAYLISLVKDFPTGLAFGLFTGFVTMIISVSTKEERPKVTSLILVFLVVVFFWMSFHQNGLTLSFFARDYTVKSVGPFTFLFFNLWGILSFIVAASGLIILLVNKKNTNRLIGAAMFVLFGALTWYLFSGYSAQNDIAPEVFQSFNPLFIVSLSFVVLGIFAWLNKKGIEPSTPKKIGIGMVIAALGFLIILIASLNLVSPFELKSVVDGKEVFAPVPDSSRVSPYWLVNSYLILTVAELFLSPMGLSFVSKVAPARFQGLMQGGWLLATAVGNKLLFIGSQFWSKIPLWQLWLIFIVCCIASALFIFSILKRLERVTKS